MGRYRLVGDHAQILDSGQPIGPGEFVDLDEVTPHDQTLIDDGLLIAADEPEKKSTKKEADA